MSDRVPPNSREAEQVVLGSILHFPKCLLEVRELLTEASFYYPHHQIIFSALIGLDDRRWPIDTVTLVENLTASQFKDIGGGEYIQTLMDTTAVGGEAVYYAKIVRGKSILRDLLFTAEEIVRDCLDQHDEPEGVLEDSQRKILALSMQQRRTDSIPLSQALIEVQRMIDDRAKGKEASGVLSELVDLDALLGGFQSGEVTIIAAGTSVGKTAFAGHICRKLADQGGASLMFALEMEAKQLAGRWLCAEADVTSTVLRYGKMSPDTAMKLVEGVRVLSPLPIWINDEPGRTVHGILAATRQLMATVPLRLLVIDYLQLALPADTSVNRNEQVAAISRGVKLIARELQIPVLLLSQLNRAFEKEKRAPTLADLRDSGTIGQDADVVLLLTRSDETIPTATWEVINIIVAKQRNGPRDTVPVLFLKQRQTFVNFAHGEAEIR